MPAQFQLSLHSHRHLQDKTQSIAEMERLVFICISRLQTVHSYFPWFMEQAFLCKSQMMNDLNKIT